MNTKILTSFRFFAACIVVIFHHGRESGLAHLTDRFLTSGPEMVTFFFVLSGFLLTVVYFDRKDRTTGDYYVARISRIAPVYFVALSIAAMLTYNQLHGINNLRGLLLSMVFLQAWFPPYPLTINGPAWAVSVEVFFYICFPLILLMLRVVKPKIATVFVISTVIYVMSQCVLIDILNSGGLEHIAGSLVHDLVLYFPLAHFSSFLFGVAGGYLVINRNIYGFTSNKLFWTMGSVISLIIIFYILDNRSFLGAIIGYLTPMSSGFLGPIFLLLILVTISGNNRLSSIFNVKPLLILGESSYCIYILQNPVYTLYMRHIASAHNFDNSVNFYTYSFILILISLLCLYLIEKPAQKIILNIWRSTK